MYLGLDIGTSRTKAALFDTDGHEHVSVACRTEVLSPKPGWYEVDGRQIWGTVISVIGALLQKAPITADGIAGVGITAVMLGAWPLDRNGELVRNPILWNDARTQTLIDGLVADDPKLYERLFARSGSILQTGCILPVLAWLRKCEPEALARTHTILGAKDYIRYRLTNRIGTDASEATIAPGSAATRDFDPDSVTTFGMDEYADRLPGVLESTAISGSISAAAAAETGLPSGIPVAVGAGDVVACTLGAGVHRQGQALSILGTACLNGVVRTEPDLTPVNLGLTFTMPDNRWLRCMVNNAGTVNLDWALHALCPELAGATAPFDACAALAGQSPPGANGVLYMPYLSQGGIIAPRIEPRARAGFMGLGPAHGRADLLRAVYEGLACAIRDCFENLHQAGPIRLVGGGARSQFWSQLIADITELPVEVPEGSQFGAKGAALCAMVGTGAYDSLESATQATFRRARTHRPNRLHSATYSRAYRAARSTAEAYLDSL